MLKLGQLLRFIRQGRPKLSEEEINRAKDELFVKVSKLKKLLSSPDWQEYRLLVEEYIDQCRIQKLRYNFAHAYMIDDNKTFKHSAFLDNDIDFAMRLLGIPQEFINDFDEMEKQKKEEEQGNAEND